MGPKAPRARFFVRFRIVSSVGLWNMLEFPNLGSRVSYLRILFKGFKGPLSILLLMI